jgi:hypothetical protein
LKIEKVLQRVEHVLEVFNSMIKGTHLTLEVKTSHGNSTPTTIPTHNPVLRSLDFPLIAIIGNTGRERRRNLHTKKLQRKLNRLRSARLTRRDQAVRLLDTQRL